MVGRNVVIGVNTISLAQQKEKVVFLQHLRLVKINLLGQHPLNPGISRKRNSKLIRNQMIIITREYVEYPPTGGSHKKVEFKAFADDDVCGVQNYLDECTTGCFSFQKL